MKHLAVILIRILGHVAPHTTLTLHVAIEKKKSDKI